MPSSDPRLKILQVSTMDIGGGAEKVAWNLFRSYRSRGQGSWMAVGQKRSEEPDISRIPNDRYRSRWARAWHAGSQRLQPLIGKVRGVARVQSLLRGIGEPLRAWENGQGHEDFNFPGTGRLLDLTPERPSIVHCHNLHGDPFAYFDLRALPRLSRQVPVVLTLHDAWLLSGHCAHSLHCERWTSGCGRCPDLSLFPAIRRDATDYNWLRKRDIYAKSRFYIATPSRWLMQKVERSILASAVIESRVIPNGVDISRFRPADKPAVRASLGLSPEANVLLFAATWIRTNIWKDFQMMRTAVARVAERGTGKRLVFLVLGEEGPSEQMGQAEIRYVPFQKDPGVVARYYQAADLYLHAARADTFPNTVLEALACGTPVVATAVGGIPEQVDDGVTGFLVRPGDAEAMAARIQRLLTDEALGSRFSANAAETARQRFDLDHQADTYLAWFHEIAQRGST